MKKTIIALSAILTLSSINPSYAAEESKGLVIIDSYFDNTVSVYKNICVATSGCTNNIVNKSKSLSDPANHGNSMVEVAKKQNSDIKIIAIRAANATAKSASEMTTGDLVRALTWVVNNSSEVSAVSLSRFFNSSKPCSPNSAGTVEFGGVPAVDKKIRSMINELKSKNIPVFVATGNKRGAKVDYPACILETNSVGVGATNKSGVIVSAYSFDSETDYFVSPSVYNYKTSLLGLIPNTTSAATAATAAKYVSEMLDSKFVNVLQ